MSLSMNSLAQGRPSTQRPVAARRHGDFALRYAVAAPVVLFAALLAMGGLKSATHRPVAQAVAVAGAMSDDMGAAGMSALSLQTSPHFH